MEQITIPDKEELKAFINAQNVVRKKACAVFIASRTALRVAPYAIRLFEFHEKSLKHGLTSMHTWHSVMISAIAATMPTEDIKKTAAGDVAYITGNDFAAYAVAHAASSAADAYAIPRAADAAENSARAAYFSYDIWREISHDAALWLDHADQEDGTLDISIAPLWSNQNSLERDWQNLREKLLVADTTDPRGADWSFWIRWYDDILEGNPQNWDMLHEIATTPDINWEASSREVNDKINGIVEAYALKNSYYFERIEFSEAKQKLIVVPEGSFDGANVQTAYQRLRDAIEDVRDAPKEGNLDPEHALRDEIRILEKTLDRPTTQPIFVVEKCFDCVKRIQARLDDATIFGHDVEDFQKALDRSAFDIIGIDEDARRVVERRTNENLLSLAKEDRDRLTHFVEEAAPIIGEDLKADLETDLSGDADPQTEGEGSTLRGISRLLRIGILVRENKDNIAFNATLISTAITVIQLIFGLF